MAAAKRVANDLMPFWLEKLGNDLMSFFSKEGRLDRLASKCTLRSQSKKIRCSIVYLHSLKRTRTYKQKHRRFTNKHTAVKTALLQLYIGRLSALCKDNYLTSTSIFDARQGRFGKDKDTNTMYYGADAENFVNLTI